MKEKCSYTETYILLDAHAIIHRAYHAIPDFTTKSGQPTGALFGLMSMIIRILTELKPDYIIACYDLPEKTFRHIAYEGYKGTRAKTDDILVEQLIKSRSIFERCNIPIYDAPGYEADDVLGTLADMLKKDKKNKVIIASGDMDTMQLIDGDQVVVYTLKKGITDTIFYDEEAVIERYGFAPSSIPDYKGLRGDTSDNIIGIKGIGEKTATILIQKYGTIENMYTALKKNQALFKKETGLTERMTLLIQDNEEEALFSKELATIQRDLSIELTPSILHHTVFNKDDVIALCEELEFKSLIPRISNLYTPQTSQTQTKTSTKKTPTSKEDGDEPVEEITVDPHYLLAVSLLDSEKIKPTAGDILAFSPAGDLDEAYTVIKKEIEKNNLGYVWREIEIPLYAIVQEMSQTGILIDVPYFKKMSDEFHAELKKLEKRIWQLAGQEFNINSPKQMGEILFTVLNLGEGQKKIKKTAGGAITTKESELEKLRDAHPIISYILEYREIQKLVSTYIDSIPLLVGPDGRIHSTFNQLGAATGRFSSNDPNLQNIPIKTERGRLIRGGFIARPGCVLLGFDYSQIELRVGALLSQDPDMLETFIQGKDIHTTVAKKVWGVEDAGVTADMRRKAKVINFGIMYGMGATALSENLSVPRKEAQIFLEEYKKQFPVLNTYLESIIDFAKTHKYTETFFGRKRNFAKINSVIPFMRAMYERMAVNAPVQGTAADIIKLAMINSYRALHEHKLDTHAHLILQVHDEIIFEVEEKYQKEVSELIEKTMENSIPVGMKKDVTFPPFTTSVASGGTWAELK